MSYAARTNVSVDKSKVEIESLLRKYGADQFVSGWTEKEARVQFRAAQRFVRFTLKLPNPQDDKFIIHPRSSYKLRSERAAGLAYEQEVRRRWRALALVVKAKLEAVNTGIASFEEEFMAHIVMPDGKTVAEHALPLIDSAYKDGKVKALLPGW